MQNFDNLLRLISDLKSSSHSILGTRVTVLSQHAQRHRDILMKKPDGQRALRRRQDDGGDGARSTCQSSKLRQPGVWGALETDGGRGPDS